jgi:ABC-type Mn2+/Zn2+ transport system ATPase subunit
MSRAAAIHLAGVEVRYPGAAAPALTVEALQIAAGSRAALIGPNGAGKSTLLKALIGLTPASGAMQVLGQPVGRARRRVAYVPQRRDVDWQFPLTARDVAQMGRDAHLRWPRWLRAADRRIAEQALDDVGMRDCAGRLLAELSGGQQQRVFLARALAQQADLLLLDEPFVGVDSPTEAVIFRVVERACAAGKTVIVATHDLATLADHFDVVVLLRGAVIAQGAPAAVMQPSLLAAAYGGPLALFYPSAASTPTAGTRPAGPALSAGQR